MKKNKRGFTLVELIVVIVIVGILTIVAVPIYRGYTLKSKITEGKSLAASIITAQRVYYTEFGEWYEVSGWINEDMILAVDAKQNSYFKQARTGVSGRYPNVISAEARADSEGVIVYQFWPNDMSQPATAYPKWLVTDLSGAVISEEW